MPLPEHLGRNPSALAIPGFATEETLARLGNDVGLYHDLLGLLATSISASRTQLEAAQTNGNRAAYRAIGHTVRGMALNVGAQALVEAATTLERQPSPQAAAVLCALLGQTQDALCSALAGGSGVELPD